MLCLLPSLLMGMIFPPLLISPDTNPGGPSQSLGDDVFFDIESRHYGSFPQSPPDGFVFFLLNVLIARGSPL